MKHTCDILLPGIDEPFTIAGTYYPSQKAYPDCPPQDAYFEIDSIDLIIARPGLEPLTLPFFDAFYDSESTMTYFEDRACESASEAYSNRRSSKED